MVVVDENPSTAGRSSSPPVLLQLSGLLEQPFKPVIELISVLVAAPVEPPVRMYLMLHRGYPVTVGVESAWLVLGDYGGGSEWD